MRIMIFGGYVDYEIRLANALSKQEQVVLLLPEAELGDEFRGELDKRVELILLGKGKPEYFMAPLLFWHIIRLLVVLPRINPDVVHVQIAGHFLITLIWLYFTIFQRRPIISTFHDVKPHQGEESNIQNILRYFIRKVSSVIIVHGVRLRQQMIEEFMVPARKIQVIPIGEHEVAPFKRYENPDIRESGRLVLFFGRIYEYKGLEYLIQAEPLITREIPGARIIIAGAGENFARYEAMIGERKNNYIIHNYRIPYPEGAELFQKSSVVVLPYIEASQSGVVLTAYGFKKPVVVTDTGSIPEIVDDAKTGLIVPPRNAEKLAEAIIKLLREPQERRRMGENGYLKLKTDLSFDSIAEKTLSTYRNILKSEETDMRNVGIITSPYALKASVPPLSHVVEIFASLAPELHVLTGYNGLAAINPDRKNVKGHLMGTKEKAGNYWVQLAKYIYANMKISFHMIKLSRRVGIWLFFLGEKTLLIPMTVGWLLRKKTIFIASDTLAALPPEQPVSLPMRLIINSCKKMNMILATRIVVYAQNLVSKDDLVRFRDKICIASEHFLDFDEFRVKSDYSRRDNRIGYIARLSKEKGILNLMDTIPLVLEKKDGVKFMIGGEGQLRDQVLKFAEGVSNKVEYVGWIDHSRLPSILNSLKLLVLPSHNEGLPNIILEAMACGTPVLATPIGAIPDLIKDSENGFIIEENSPEYNAGKILQILNTPGLEKISRAGRELVEKEYTFEKAVERYKRIIDKL